jgi:hypothetical protein
MNEQELLEKIRKYILDNIEKWYNQLTECTQYDTGMEVTTDEIEYEPRDGFIPFTEGGATASTFTRLIDLENATPKALHQYVYTMLNTYNQDYEKDAGGYDGFYEYMMNAEDADVLIYLRVQIYDAGNSRGLEGDKPSCYVKFAVNTECPYFRDYMPVWAGGQSNEWKVEHEFSFDSMNEFIKRIKNTLDKLEKEVL